MHQSPPTHQHALAASQSQHNKPTIVIHCTHYLLQDTRGSPAISESMPAGTVAAPVSSDDACGGASGRSSSSPCAMGPPTGVELLADQHRAEDRLCFRTLGPVDMNIFKEDFVGVIGNIRNSAERIFCHWEGRGQDPQSDLTWLCFAFDPRAREYMGRPNYFDYPNIPLRVVAEAAQLRLSIQAHSLGHALPPGALHAYSRISWR